MKKMLTFALPNGESGNEKITKEVVILSLPKGKSSLKSNTKDVPG